jgi:hypothetical protein
LSLQHDDRKALRKKNGIRNVAFITKSTIRQARVLPEVNCGPP